jgi:hypothetical protein
MGGVLSHTPGLLRLRSTHTLLCHELCGRRVDQVPVLDTHHAVLNRIPDGRWRVCMRGDL